VSDYPLKKIFYSPFKKIFALSVVLLMIGLGLLQVPTASADFPAQQPTGSIPTVTSSPEGFMVTPKTGEGSEEQVNVRSGPASNYARVGVLTRGQYAPALGRSAGGDWILISYPGSPDGTGWIYSPYIDIIGLGELPIAEPPATPTPVTTPTIDPTLAAQFIIEVPPTGLPTFTPPSPLIIPTYTAATASSPSTRIPLGIVIIGMGVVGLFGVLISILRGR
jgi:hypothetical protein